MPCAVAPAGTKLEVPPQGAPKCTQVSGNPGKGKRAVCQDLSETLPSSLHRETDLGLRVPTAAGTKRGPGTSKWRQFPAMGQNPGNATGPQKSLQLRAVNKQGCCSPLPRSLTMHSTTRSEPQSYSTQKHKPPQNRLTRGPRDKVWTRGCQERAGMRSEV